MKKYVGLIVSIVIAVILCAVVTVYRISLPEVNGNIFHALSDGLFVAGVVYTFAGALGFISDAGGFDGFAFMWYTIVHKLTPIKEQFENRKTYYEFKLEKAKQDKRKHNTLWIGLAFILLALIFAFIATK